MQKLFVFLAVFSAVAVAYPKVTDQRYESFTAYPITFSEYLNKVLGKNPGLVAMSIPLVSEGEVASRLESLGLREMAKIARQVDLNRILTGQDAFTLFAPTDEAVQNWKKQVPELAADQDAMTRLCKAWIVPSALRSSSIVNEKVEKTMEGATLRFNIYDQTKSVTCNGAAITEADQQVLNGLVHVVDRVIYPLADGDVFQTLDGHAEFSKFIELVELAEIKRELATSASDPLTLFAPINEAFEKLPWGVMAELEADKPKLQQLIRYHVARGTRYSAGLADGQQIQTKDNRMIDIGIKEEGKIQLNRDQSDECDEADQTQILYADLPATNGVIHVIDNVLVPRDARYTLEL